MARGSSQGPQCLLQDQAALLPLTHPLPPLGFTDQEAIQELESSLKEVRNMASATALYYAGLFLWLMGRHDKAREYINRTLKISSSSREVPASGVKGTAAAESSLPTQPRVVAVTPAEHPGTGRAPYPGTDETPGLIGAPTHVVSVVS